MKKLIILTLAVLLLSGCTEPTIQVADEAASKITTRQPSRFKVTIAERFHDTLAYGNYRAIYIIRDLETGVEYIGISGVGISEVGAHSTGKNQTSRDER